MQRSAAQRTCRAQYHAAHDAAHQRPYFGTGGGAAAAAA